MFDKIKFITLKVSTYCNLDCAYCYETLASKEKAIKFELYDELLEFLKKLPLDEDLEIGLTGGEPSFCIDEIYEAYNTLKKIERYKPTKLNFDIITNGSNFKGIIELINNGVLNPFNCNLSWDGIYTASKSRFVKNKAYDDEFFNNVIKELGNSGDYIRKNMLVRTAITKNTIDSVFDSYKFFINNGGTRWDYYLINKDPLYEDTKFLDKVFEELKKIYIYARDHHIAENIINIEDMLYYFFDFTEEQRKMAISCRHLGKSMLVNATGNIYPCTMGDNISKYTPCIVLGNIIDGFDCKVMEDFCEDYFKQPSCDLKYKGEDCKCMNCFECMMTCKYYNKSLQGKMRNQCEYRHREYNLFKEVFVDSGYKFDQKLLDKVKRRYSTYLLAPKRKLNPDLPFNDKK